MPESMGRGLELKETKYPEKQILRKSVDVTKLNVGPHSYLSDTSNANPYHEVIFKSKFRKIIKETFKDYNPTKFLDKNYFDHKFIKSDKYAFYAFFAGKVLSVKEQLQFLAIALEKNLIFEDFQFVVKCLKSHKLVITIGLFDLWLACTSFDEMIQKIDQMAQEYKTYKAKVLSYDNNIEQVKNKYLEIILEVSRR